MKTHTVCLLAVVLTVCLTGAFQVKCFVGALRSSEGDCLAEKDGRVMLARSRISPAPSNEGLQPVWHINAPNLRTPGGKLLAIEQTSAGAKFYLATEKSAATRWVIDVTSQSRPERPKSGSVDERGGMWVGTARSTFRLRVFDGIHEGWYVGADKPIDDAKKSTVAKVDFRNLNLVENPKEALSFEYIETKYDIGHK